MGKLCKVENEIIDTKGMNLHILFQKLKEYDLDVTMYSSVAIATNTFEWVISARILGIPDYTNILYLYFDSVGKPKIEDKLIDLDTEDSIVIFYNSTNKLDFYRIYKEDILFNYNLLFNKFQLWKLNI